MEEDKVSISHELVPQLLEELNKNEPVVLLLLDILNTLELQLIVELFGLQDAQNVQKQEFYWLVLVQLVNDTSFAGPEGGLVDSMLSPCSSGMPSRTSGCAARW